MSNMVKNEISVGKFTLLGSTNTTSITVVTAVTSTNSTASTGLTITSQTIYFDSGCIHDLGTASSTTVLNP